MKRTATIPVLAALSLLALTGCSQGSGQEAAPSPSTTVKAVVFSPAQENTLRTQLRSVDVSLDIPASCRTRCKCAR